MPFDIEKIKGVQTREMTMGIEKPMSTRTEEEKTAVKESRTITMSVSSETEEVTRYYGVEVLGHNNEEIRLTRLRSKANLLFNHNRDDYLAVIEKVEIGEDRKLRATVRFGKSEFAEEKFQDVLDGVLVNTSLRYEIYMAKLTQRGDGNKIPDKYRITDWEPVECSLVTIPADINVGVGRSVEIEQNTINKGERTMSDIKETPVIDVNTEREKAIKSRNEEVKEILAMGAKFGGNLRDFADKCVNEGKSLEESRELFIAELAKVKGTGVTEVKIDAEPRGYEAPSKDVKEFSMIRAINALFEAKNGKSLRAFAPHEVDMSEDFLKKADRRTGGIGEHGGIVIPLDVMRAYIAGENMRVGNIAVGSSAGFLTQPTVSSDFITLLRNQTKVIQMGARVINGEGISDIIINGQGAATTAYQVGEADAATLSYISLIQKKLSPKTTAIRTGYSRLSVKATNPSYEALVRQDMIDVAGLSMDYLALYGSGAAGEPVGVKSTTGIGSVVGGTNGLAPTWSHMVELKTAVAKGNALLGNLGFLSTASVAGKLEVTPRFTNTGTPILNDNGTVGRYRFEESEQVKSTMTKAGSGAVCSDIFFGNWSDLLICQWGGVEIALQQDVAPNGTGNWYVVLFIDWDCLVRRAASFSLMSDAIGL